MLNDKEKRVLARYALMPMLIKASIWMIPGVILLIIFLEYINDNYMYATGLNDLGILMAFASIVFFIVAGILARTALKRAPYNKSLQAITQRIEAIYISDYATDDNELSLADISKATRSAYFEGLDHYLQGVFHIFDYYPKTMLKRVLFVVVPCLLIICSYIPSYIYNYSAYKNSCKEVTEVMTSLADAFDGYEIYYDDPYENYREYGYSFIAYTGDNFDDYIIVDILNDGSIDYVAYALAVDISIDKEENLIDMQDKLNQFYNLLVSANVTIDEKFLVEPILGDDFIAALLENNGDHDSGYSEVRCGEE